uniref:Putative nucleoside triphosphate kinase n=1 Tax=Taenia solium TaxID=6204 RepID=Q8MPC5_TAESO|nr:putative nucleoside triphosphate kinase [Taenia solium]
MSAGQRLTLAVFKPDVQRIGVYRQYAEEAIRGIGLEPLVHREFRMSRGRAEAFYAAHRAVRLVYTCWLANRPFRSGENSLVQPKPIGRFEFQVFFFASFSSRTVIFQPASLRGCFGLTDTRNGFHGSDGDESAKEEIKFFFPDFDFTLKDKV